MPAGTVVASTLNLAVKTNTSGAPTLTGTFNQSGGTVSASTLNLLKSGGGKWTLDAGNSYTGTTSISQGELELNGSTGSGATTVSSGATLSGSGTVGAALTAQTGSTVRIGDSLDPEKLASRLAAPAWLDPASDAHRLLGAAVAGLVIDGLAVALDDPRLAEGWHAPEAGWRWTAGAATLPAADACLVEVRLKPFGRFWRDCPARRARAA
jgi:autotransporter-associated beta strand protein